MPEQNDEAVRISVQHEGHGEVYTVVKLEVDGDAFEIPPADVDQPEANESAKKKKKTFEPVSCQIKH